MDADNTWHFKNLLLLLLWFSPIWCTIGLQLLISRYCSIHFTVTVEMSYLPVALYCTSLMACKTLSAKIYRKNSLEAEKRKVADFNKSALATQLEMMQSLQPNTLWFTVCIPVFNSQFHSSWHAHNMLFQPYSSCPACTFDKKKGKKKITFIKSLVWGLNPCHQTKGWLGTLWSWIDPSKKGWMAK